MAFFEVGRMEGRCSCCGILLSLPNEGLFSDERPAGSPVPVRVYWLSLPVNEERLEALQC